MNRRELLKGAIAGSSAFTARAQPTRPDLEQTVSSKALLFDAHQSATVAIMADLIIPTTDTPGAAAARVHEYIDLILHDGPTGPRTEFLEGLGWMDGFALRRYGAPFVRCTRPQQTAIFTTVDYEDRAGVAASLNRAGTPDRASEPDRATSPPERPAGSGSINEVAELGSGTLFFRQLKLLTIQGYYTSKIGIEELNKGNRVPERAGCMDHTAAR